MTAINQNFTMYAGDTKNIVISMTDEKGNVLDVSGGTVKWILRKNKPIAPIDVEKTSPEIKINIDKITIKLLPEDTVNLVGMYYHEAQLTDQFDNVSTILVGNVTIYKSYA